MKLFLFFFAETEQGVALAILRGVIDFKREPWPQISESAKSLVRMMLEQDPKKRPTAQQVLGKPIWLFILLQKLWLSFAFFLHTLIDYLRLRVALVMSITTTTASK